MTSEELNIFGEKIGMPQRKYPKTKNATHQRANFSLAITILERYKNATLAGDIMFINGIRFINTIVRHIKFMTAEHIANSKVSTLQ